jgi:phosphopantothenoylcysteine synthetase/decarboxylase
MKILVTAGATWVKIDDVRILTTRFTGRTGIEIARSLQKSGHDVTLLINPHCVAKELGGLKTIEFKYYEELKSNLQKLLKTRHFDCLIHSAAVSDYILPKPVKGKIASNKKQLELKLRPSQKLTLLARSIAPNLLIVQFKLEARRFGLIDKAYASLKRNHSDFVVANALSDLDKKYKAYFVNSGKEFVALNSRKELIHVLGRILSHNASKCSCCS